ncbi:MAG: response regulator transcription factor [Verrucomicrobiae bacterium]|nr:response regulator transcription factor [Verrucomicrobiae bacterium]
MDHQPISRYLLSQIINAEPDLTVCGVSDGLANLPRVIRASNPDLVIIEIAGKSADGLEALRAIREADIRVPVLVFSGGSCEANAIAAMRAGANGYVCKNENKSTLLRAIRLLLRGEERLCREMTARLVKDFSLGFVDARPLPVDLLTAREMNIFKLLARGLNPRQIARRANMDLHAVQSCRQRLKTKLELSSVQELQCAATRWLASQTSATA